MKKQDVLNELTAAKAILQGHFILSSGLRSPMYLQCARLLMYPERAERCCAALARKVAAALPKADAVVSPAMGGVVVGYEMGRQLGLPAMFCERVEGNFTLRRGFELNRGDRVIVVEDVVTTGKSSKETFDCIRSFGAEIVGEACLIDRSGGKAELGVPLVSLLELEVPTYDPAHLPAELAAIPAVKPGSRGLKQSA